MNFIARAKWLYPALSYTRHPPGLPLRGFWSLRMPTRLTYGRHYTSIGNTPVGCLRAWLQYRKEIA